MNCCEPSNNSVTVACPACGNGGQIVTRQTVAHQIKSDKLSVLQNSDYRYCNLNDCSVVYYSSDGNSFRTDEVRELHDDRTLCYCFGFTEEGVRREIVLRGETTIPAQISKLIKEKLCACEIRNPSGRCCLGDVNKTVKGLVIKISQT